MKTATKYATAARDFAFQGMTFGDPPVDIEDHFADWSYDEDASDPKAGIDVYTVAASGVDFAKLFFFGEQLFQIKLIYGVDRLNAMGDWSAIAERLVAKFGKANGNSLGIMDVEDSGRFVHFAWEFEAVDREIVFEVFTGFAMVTFCDSNMSLAAYNQKKRQADIGF